MNISHSNMEILPFKSHTGQRLPVPFICIFIGVIVDSYNHEERSEDFKDFAILKNLLAPRSAQLKSSNANHIIRVKPPHHYTTATPTHPKR